MMEYLQFDRFFPFAVPPILTVLTCIFLSTIAYQALKTGISSRENRWLFLYCVLQGLFAADKLMQSLISSAEVSIYSGSFAHFFWVYSLPISFALIHSSIGAKRRWLERVAWVVSGISCVAVLTPWYFKSSSEHFFGYFVKMGPGLGFFTLCALLSVIYFAVILLKARAVVDADTKLRIMFIFSGTVVNYVFMLMNIFPALGYEIYPLGNFGFIPLALFAFGILSRNLYKITTELLEQGVIINLLRLFLWIPVVFSVFLILIKPELFYDNLYDRIVPWGLPPLVTAFVCLGMATIALSLGLRELKSVILALFAASWGFLGVDTFMVSILKSEDIALKISRMDHAYLVFSFGFFVHIFHFFAPEKISRRSVAVAYIFSALISLGTQSRFYFSGMHHYFWGYFGRKSFLFDLWSTAAMVTMIVIVVILFRLKNRSNLKPLLAAAVLTVTFNFASVPAVNGIEIYPGGNFSFIPMIFFAYAVLQDEILKSRSGRQLRYFSIFLRAAIYSVFIIYLCLIASSWNGWNVTDLLKLNQPYFYPLLLSLLVASLIFFTSYQFGRSQKMLGILSVLSLMLCQLFTLLILFALIRDSRTALMLDQINYLTIIFLPPIYVHLYFYVCGGRISFRWVTLYYVFGGLCGLSVFSEYFIVGHEFNGRMFLGKPGPVFSIWGAASLLAEFLVLSNIFRIYRKLEDPVHRQRIMYYGVSFLITGILNTGNFLALQNKNLIPTGFFSFIPLSLLFFGIFRYNLREALLEFRNLLLNLILFVFPLLILILLIQWMTAAALVFTILQIHFWPNWRSIVNNFLDVVFGTWRHEMHQKTAKFLETAPAFGNISRTFEELNKLLVKSFGSRGTGFLFPENRFIRVLSKVSPVKDLVTGGQMVTDSFMLPLSHPIMKYISEFKYQTDRRNLENWEIRNNQLIERQFQEFELIQPILFENRIQAVLLVAPKKNNFGFTAAEKDLIQRIAQGLGGVLKNSEMLESLEALISMRTLELEEQRKKANELREEAMAERAKSDQLLLNVLPGSVADELKQKGNVQPKYFPDVSVMFTDFSGFTRKSENMEPETVVTMLNDIFAVFDRITGKYGLEKIKTMGDAYMVAGGIPVANHTHSTDICLAALEIREAMREFNFSAYMDDPLEIRIGIHRGPAMAAVVGNLKFSYDIFGDTVNVASRMEANSIPGQITISAAVQEKVKFFFDCASRGPIKIKNHEPVHTYFLEGLKPAYGNGTGPNQKFRRYYDEIARGKTLKFKREQSA